MALEIFKKQLQELRFAQNKLSELHIKDLNAARAMVETVYAAGEGVAAEAALEQLHSNSPEFHFYYYYKAIFACLQKKSPDEALKKLFPQLLKNGRANLMENIALEILAQHPSPFLLSHLARYYEKNGAEKKSLEYYQRLVELRRDDFQLAKKVAQLYEKQKAPAAVEYYKLAFQIALEKGEHLEALTLWKKLALLASQEIDFLFSWIKRLSSHLEKEQLEEAFLTLVRNEEKKENTNWTVVLLAIKTAFEVGVNFHPQLTQLSTAYQKLYEGHSHLNDFFNLSGLARLIRNRRELKSPQLVLQSIQNFEKQIRFDTNTMVRHRYFGLGIIRSIKRSSGLLRAVGEETYLTIDFEKKRNHRMSLRIAINSLSLPANNHLTGLKYFHPELLQQILTGDETNLARSILETLEKPVQQKEIQQFMVPTFFSAAEWKKRWSGLKKVLQSEQEFEYFNKTYRLRLSVESLDERTLKELNRTTQAKEKIRIIEAYFLNKQTPSEAVTKEIVKQLLELIKNEKTALRFLVFFHHLVEGGKITLEYDFKENFLLHYNRENFRTAFLSVHSQAMRFHSLRLLKEYLGAEFESEMEASLALEESDYDEVLLEYLLHQKQQALLQRISEQLRETYLTAPRKFFWLVKTLMSGALVLAEVNYGELLLKMVRLLSEINKNINLEKDISVNRKLFIALHHFLFNDELLFNWLKDKLPPQFENFALSGEEKELIFSELEKQTFLENYLKVQIRALHEQYR